MNIIENENLYHQRMTHLSHLIPWNTLSEVINYTDRFPNQLYQKINNAEYKNIKFFVKSLYSALNSFAESVKDETIVDKKLNLLKWDDEVLVGCGGHLGVLTSVISAYIQLNVLLTNIDKFKDRITPDNWVLKCCRGLYDGGHPDFINELFNELIFYNNDNQKSYFKEFNREVSYKIHEYLKLLFKILYLHIKSERVDISGHGKITETMIFYIIHDAFCINLYDHV